MYYRSELKFYESTLNSNSNRQGIFWAIGNPSCSVWWFVFFEFLTPSTLGGCNFLKSIPFWTMFSLPDAPIRGVQILFGHKNNRALSFDPACTEHLSVWSLASLPNVLGKAPGQLLYGNKGPWGEMGREARMSIKLLSMGYRWCRNERFFFFFHVILGWYPQDITRKIGHLALWKQKGHRP